MPSTRASAAAAAQADDDDDSDIGGGANTFQRAGSPVPETAPLDDLQTIQQFNSISVLFDLEQQKPRHLQKVIGVRFHYRKKGTRAYTKVMMAVRNTFKEIRYISHDGKEFPMPITVGLEVCEPHLAGSNPTGDDVWRIPVEGYEYYNFIGLPNEEASEICSVPHLQAQLQQSVASNASMQNTISQQQDQIQQLTRAMQGMKDKMQGLESGSRAVATAGVGMELDEHNIGNWKAWETLITDKTMKLHVGLLLRQKLNTKLSNPRTASRTKELIDRLTNCVDMILDIRNRVVSNIGSQDELKTYCEKHVKPSLAEVLAIDLGEQHGEAFAREFKSQMLRPPDEEFNKAFSNAVVVLKAQQEAKKATGRDQIRRNQNPPSRNKKHPQGSRRGGGGGVQQQQYTVQPPPPPPPPPRGGHGGGRGAAGYYAPQQGGYNPLYGYIPH